MGWLRGNQLGPPAAPASPLKKATDKKTKVGSLNSILSNLEDWQRNEALPCWGTCPPKTRRHAAFPVDLRRFARSLEPNVITCSAAVSACEKALHWREALHLVGFTEGARVKRWHSFDPKVKLRKPPKKGGAGHLLFAICVCVCATCIGVLF